MHIKLITALIFFSISLSAIAAVNETEFHSIKNFRDDIKTLKRILNQKPDNLSALKNLARIYFVIEDFKSAKKYASKYLSIKNDKDLAYMKIICHANRSKYRLAIIEIENFLKTYYLTSKEKADIKIKQDLFREYFATKPYPYNAQRIEIDHNKFFISFLDRKKVVLGFDNGNQKFFYYNYFNGKISVLMKAPEFLKGISGADLFFLSMSSDGRKILASIKTGEGSAEIIMKQYSAPDATWLPWESFSEMNPGSWNSYGNFTSDSSAVLFTSNADKKRGYDIYITSNDGDSWSAPVKLANANTVSDEYSVFLHHDGETLIFSTNGRSGMGGFDLYSTRLNRKEDKYNIVKSINIKKFNTYRNEINPIIIDSRGKTGFLNFPLAGKNYTYKVDGSVAYPKAICFFKGYVFDRKTKKPIKDASIRIMSIGRRELRGALKLRTYSDGFFGTSIRHRKYVISINAKGYLYNRNYINISTNRHSFRKNFYLKKEKIKKGFSFVADNIYFETGSYNLAEDSIDELEDLYNFLISYPEITIQISGFTDNTGSYDYNMELSKKRAKSIADYIGEKGINRRRMVEKGFGATRWAASNLTAEGRRRNRRVEITVTGIN